MRWFFKTISIHIHAVRRVFFILSLFFLFFLFAFIGVTPHWERILFYGGSLHFPSSLEVSRRVFLRVASRDLNRGPTAPYGRQRIYATPHLSPALPFLRRHAPT
jgi:hypothetical protein